MYTESSFSVTYPGYITSINYFVESFRLLDVVEIQVFSTVTDDDMEEDLLLSIKLSVDILMGQTNGKQSFISSRRTDILQWHGSREPWSLRTRTSSSSNGATTSLVLP